MPNRLTAIPARTMPMRTAVRMGMVLAGIAVSLFGIMGLITPAYQKTWIGKR